MLNGGEEGVVEKRRSGCSATRSNKFAWRKRSITEEEKRSECLEFYWDFTTVLRKYKHEYRPREKKVTNTSLCSATEEEPIPGVSVYDAGHEMQSDDVNQTGRFINNCIQRR